MPLKIIFVSSALKKCEKCLQNVLYKQCLLKCFIWAVPLKKKCMSSAFKQLFMSNAIKNIFMSNALKQLFFMSSALILFFIWSVPSKICYKSSVFKNVFYDFKHFFMSSVYKNNMSNALKIVFDLKETLAHSKMRKLLNPQTLIWINRIMFAL